jgi:ankyrin repeat protein
MLLLERGADPHARDNRYATPWLLARYHGRFDIARLLLYYDTKAPTKND